VEDLQICEVEVRPLHASQLASLQPPPSLNHSLGGIQIDAHVGAIGSIESAPIDECPEEWTNELCQVTAVSETLLLAVAMKESASRRFESERNSIGSRD
jgi:hypothetical protein